MDQVKVIKKKEQKKNRKIKIKYSHKLDELKELKVTVDRGEEGLFNGKHSFVLECSFIECKGQKFFSLQFSSIKLSLQVNVDESTWVNLVLKQLLVSLETLLLELKLKLIRVIILSFLLSTSGKVKLLNWS